MQAGLMQAQGLFKLNKGQHVRIVKCMIISLLLVALINCAYLVLLVSQINLDKHHIEPDDDNARKACLLLKRLFKQDDIDEISIFQTFLKLVFFEN
jgi:hypothetical protein